jgi:hypothetical protein
MLSLDPTEVSDAMIAELRQYPILEQALSEIGLVPVPYYWNGQINLDRYTIMARKPHFLCHELAHGRECTPEQIGWGNFGLDQDGHVANVARECRALGYQAGLMDRHEVSLFSGISVLRSLEGALEGIIESLSEHRQGAWFDQPPRLERTLYQTNVPTADDCRQEFRSYYARGLEEGMDGCIRVWQEKLSECRKSPNRLRFVLDSLTIMGHVPPHGTAYRDHDQR